MYSIGLTYTFMVYAPSAYTVHNQHRVHCIIYMHWMVCVYRTHMWLLYVVSHIYTHVCVCVYTNIYIYIFRSKHIIYIHKHTINTDCHTTSSHDIQLYMCLHSYRKAKCETTAQSDHCAWYMVGVHPELLCSLTVSVVVICLKCAQILCLVLWLSHMWTQWHKYE